MKLIVVDKQEQIIKVALGDIVQINEDYYIVMENVANSKKRLRHLGGHSYYGGDFDDIDEVVKKPFVHYSRDKYELRLVKKEEV